MKKIILFSSFVLFSFGSFAQTTETDNLINEKFTDLIEASNSFKGYKVVDYDKLTALQGNVSARIESLKIEITEYKNSIETQNEKIEALKAELAGIQAQLEKVTAEKDAITFLTIPFDKSSYKIIMWGVVGILILALVLFIVKFKKSHVHTREARKNLAETEKEFEAFRAKSLEKEQRLGRLLQDERNKLMKSTK